MKLALVDCGSKKVAAMADMIARAGAEVSVLPLVRGEEALSADAVVISGGPRLFTSEPSLVEAFAFIDRLRVPTLGICLGHQAIGLRHGAEVFLGEPRREPEPIRILEPHPLLEGLGEEVIFAEDHTEGITLPPGFRRLGSSAAYEVEIMACDERRLFGVQFHPEVSGEVGQKLLGRFVELAR